MRQKKKRTIFEKLPEPEQRIVKDRSIAPEVAAFMTHLNATQIASLRNNYKYQETRAAASRAHRERKRKENIEKFGKKHACYNFWTDAEIKLIMESTETDAEIAKQLNRTVEAIQQKRSRELKKRRS